jgi:hypothetical protein
MIKSQCPLCGADVEWPEGWVFGSEADLAAERAVHQIYSTPWSNVQNHRTFALLKSAVVKAIAESHTHDL